MAGGHGAPGQGRRLTDAQGDVRARRYSEGLSLTLLTRRKRCRTSWPSSRRGDPSEVPSIPSARYRCRTWQQILEAARWSPTAHNMQNFEILVIDASEVLAETGRHQLAGLGGIHPGELRPAVVLGGGAAAKKVGILGTMFPAAWRTPGADFEQVARESGPSFLRDTIKDSPTVLIVTYDARKRAPASEGDVLGFISLGCAMENMWLVAQSLGIGCQIMSVFSGNAVEPQVKQILAIPEHMKIAFAARLGYPVPGFQVREGASGREGLRAPKPVRYQAHRLIRAVARTAGTHAAGNRPPREPPRSLNPRPRPSRPPHRPSRAARPPSSASG